MCVVKKQGSRNDDGGDDEDDEDDKGQRQNVHWIEIEIEMMVALFK